MTVWWRKFVLTVHVLSSVGWAGAVAVFFVLDLTAQLSRDANMGRLFWLMLEATTWSLIIPLAVTSLITGIVSALGTAWGLFRHYWVLFKLALTIVATIVLVLYTQTISAVASNLANPVVAGSGLPSALLHTGGGLLVLLLTAVLAVYKPRGMTSYGLRKRRLDGLRRPAA